MAMIGHILMNKFQTVASIFRYFDMKLVGSVTFPDFSFGIEKLDIDVSKDESLQIFTFLDSNRDNILRFPDFCALISYANSNR